MRGAEAEVEAVIAAEIAAGRDLEDVVTDLGVEEGGTGTAVTTEGGATGAMTGERETEATPGTTGGAATAQTDLMTK